MAEYDTIHALASSVIERCLAFGLKVATAESCTGGLVAGALTGVSGSSGVVDRGFVTYSNEAKAEMLGVDNTLIEAHGAVSEPVARAMAEGALAHSRADMTVAITGIAGPGGGSGNKPVGLVHFACASKGAPTRHLERRYGELGRENVREAAVKEALELMLERVRLNKNI
jgi:nicotinamide-nucleotide amidase